MAEAGSRQARPRASGNHPLLRNCPFGGSKGHLRSIRCGLDKLDQQGLDKLDHQKERPMAPYDTGLSDVIIRLMSWYSGVCAYFFAFSRYGIDGSPGVALFAGL